MAVPLTTGTDAGQIRAEVLRVTRIVCPPVLRDHVEDFAQIATLRILAKLREKQEKGDDTELAQAFLWRVVKSVIIDELRRRQRRPADELAPDPPIESPAPDPERQAIAREEFEALIDCVSRLSPDRRRAVTLYLQEHGRLEISTILECGLKRADNLLYRGIDDVLKCLESKGVRR